MHFRELHHLTVCICFILESVSRESKQQLQTREMVRKSNNK